MESASTVNPVRNVGIVGLGDQGRPIAQHLLAAGWPLYFHARRDDVRSEFKDLGATPLPPLELAAAVDLLLLVVVDDTQIRALLEQEGMLAAMRPGGIIAIHSTIAPQFCRALHGQAAVCGVALIDAPVSGGRDRSYAGDLTIFAGGAPAAIDAARPVFAAYASRVVRFGEIGAGQTAKLINNYFYAAHLATAAKAVELIHACGLDREAAAIGLPSGSGSSAAFAIQAARNFERTAHDKGSAYAVAILSQAVADLRTLAKDASVSLEPVDALVDEALRAEAARDAAVASQSPSHLAERPHARAPLATAGDRHSVPERRRSMELQPEQPRLRPRNLSHVAIGVSDMEASLAFYCGVVGLELSVDRPETMTRPEFRTERRGCYLRWADGDDTSFIVLDQTINPTRSRGEAKPLFDIGVHHFGFWVDDVDAIVARAVATGHDVAMPAIDADSGGYGEAQGRPVRVAMLRDPDGNFVQIDQRNDG